MWREGEEMEMAVPLAPPSSPSSPSFLPFSNGPERCARGAGRTHERVSIQRGSGGVRSVGGAVRASTGSAAAAEQCVREQAGVDCACASCDGDVHLGAAEGLASHRARARWQPVISCGGGGHRHIPGVLRVRYRLLSLHW